MDDSNERLVVLFHADENAVEGHAVDKREGAINRVDDPPSPGVGSPLAELLADQTVIRESQLDRLADIRLRLSIRYGYR